MPVETEECLCVRSTLTHLGRRWQLGFVNGGHAHASYLMNFWVAWQPQPTDPSLSIEISVSPRFIVFLPRPLLFCLQGLRSEL